MKKKNTRRSKVFATYFTTLSGGRYLTTKHDSVKHDLWPPPILRSGFVVTSLEKFVFASHLRRPNKVRT